MAALKKKQGSSSPKQRQTLVIAGKRRGMALSEIRSMVGGSISELSSAEASAWITKFSGRDLQHEPGTKRSAYAGKKAEGLRMITQDHVEQITRMGVTYFENESAFENWLDKNFKVRDPWKLGTAARAGEVIKVLKAMHDRRDSR